MRHHMLRGQKHQVCRREGKMQMKTVQKVLLLRRRCAHTCSKCFVAPDSLQPWRLH